MDCSTSEEGASLKDPEFLDNAGNKKILVKGNSAKSGFFLEKNVLKMGKCGLRWGQGVLVL